MHDYTRFKKPKKTHRQLALLAENLTHKTIGTRERGIDLGTHSD
jgi:hypothetical protein